MQCLWKSSCLQCLHLPFFLQFFPFTKYFLLRQVFLPCLYVFCLQPRIFFTRTWLFLSCHLNSLNLRHYFFFIIFALYFFHCMEKYPWGQLVLLCQPCFQCDDWQLYLIIKKYFNEHMHSLNVHLSQKSYCWLFV